MLPADANRFRDLLRAMGRVLGQEPDAVILDAYWLALRDWELSEFEQACGHLLKTSKFFPRPNAFEELRKAGRPTSGEAWARVLDYVRNNYSHHTPGSLDPMTDRAVRAIGGYRAVAMSTHDQTPFLERRFAEHYEQISEAEDTREAVPNLGYTPRKFLNGPRGFTHTAYLEHDEDEPELTQ